MGCSDAFSVGYNRYAIDPKEVTCDYYEYLDGKPEGVRSYNGQYMSQYSWGEVTLAELCDRDDRE